MAPKVLTSGRKILPKVGKFCVKNHLPIGLVLVIILGSLWPKPGVYLGKAKMQYVCVVIIFFCSGLKLKTDDIKEALKSVKAVVWGFFSILFLTVVIGIEMTKAISGQFDDPVPAMDFANETRITCGSAGNETFQNKPFGPQDFNVGAQVFFAMPCTISSGIVLVRLHDCAAGRVFFELSHKLKILTKTILILVT